ncbi:MAG TPA: glycosyl hydrolase family 28 protein [Terracidiphilus sp.]|nr:glycosyl hydrolase family 28 protein [Terracidiphilus sp.]
MLRRDFLAASSLAVGLTAARMAFASLLQTKNVQEYGARPDGRTMNTEAIQRAIDETAHAGGGIVHVPAGRYRTGRLDLRSRVTLSLDEGCVLLGSTSLSDYQGAGEKNKRHLIYASNAEQVALTGPGHIDGQGTSFWESSGRAALPPDQAWADVASHALKPKSSGRPSPMILFSNCRGVRVDAVHLENSPGWTLHTLNCDDVQITGITIRNPVNGPNTDGIDITGCQNVLVSGCSVQTGDDAICLKSENPLGAEPRLVKNVTVTKCSLSTCCNGFKLGTSSEGGFENIVFSNSVIHNDAVPLGERVISGVALEVIDGGWIDGVQVSGIQMQRTRTPIFIRLGNRKRVHDYSQHGLRRVVIENIQASETVLASSITGIPGDLVDDITLSDLRIENALPSRSESISSAVPEKDNAYPEARMFGMLPASGLYVRHARNLHMKNLEFSASSQEGRPTLLFDDVDGVRVSGFKSTPVSGHAPVVGLLNAREVTISDSVAPAGTDAFIAVAGGNSANIVLAGDDLHGSRRPFQTGNDVPPQAVTVTPRGD